jgi:hypothetical protein
MHWGYVCLGRQAKNYVRVEIFCFQARVPIWNICRDSVFLVILSSIRCHYNFFRRVFSRGVMWRIEVLNGPSRERMNIYAPLQILGPRNRSFRGDLEPCCCSGCYFATVSHRISASVFFIPDIITYHRTLAFFYINALSFPRAFAESSQSREFWCLIVQHARLLSTCLLFHSRFQGKLLQNKSRVSFGSCFWYVQLWPSTWSNNRSVFLGLRVHGLESPMLWVISMRNKHMITCAYSNSDMQKQSLFRLFFYHVYIWL